jgi:hypothetical protein
MKLHQLLKNGLSALTATGLLVAFTTLTACKSDPEPPAPEPTEAEKITAILTGGTGRWSLASVVVEGENAAELFKDFSITFTSTNYTTTGTTPVWKRSGTWSFTDATATKFKRDDNVEVTIESISDTQLKLTLIQAQQVTEGGRSTALRGKHEFVMNK